MRPTTFFLFLVCCCIGVSAPSNADVLVLNNPTGPPLTTANKSGLLDIVVGEAFRQNGLELSLVRLPAERGLKNADAGIEDGDLSRIAGLERAYPNLRRIPEKIFDMRFVGFTKDRAITVDGWQGLRNYTIGVIAGWKIFENNIPKGTISITAKSADQLFSMLEKDRVDIALYSRLMGLHQLSMRPGLAAARALSPPLAEKEMFVYLHKRHENIIPALAATLAQMKASGFYDRVFDETARKLTAGD